MPTYRATTSVAALSVFRPDLRPNDRFGLRGGKVRVRAVLVTGGAAGDMLETIFVGNEMVENRAILSLEPAANRGVDNYIPAVEAAGGGGDVIDVQYTNTNAAARSVAYVIEIENVP